MRVEFGGMQQKSDRGAGAGKPVPYVTADRQHRFLPGERLAQDVGEEPRSRQVRLARADNDGGQPDADAVHKPPPRIVVEEQLYDRLLCTVTGQRCSEELVADRFGEWRAEHSDRRGEHQLREIGAVDALQPDRIEQQARAVKIDPVAFLEIGLRLARNDGRQVEYEIGARSNERLCCAGGGEIGGNGLDSTDGAQLPA
jgi:hypothetical protein